MRRQRRKRDKGQSLVESLLGLAIMIPLALFAIDIVALINAAHMNDEWSETAAKVAARQGTERMARESAEKAVLRVPLSQIVQSIRVDDVSFDPVEGHVMVTTIMDVKLPVSFPNMEIITFRCKAIQPIVSTRTPI